LALLDDRALADATRSLSGNGIAGHDFDRAVAADVVEDAASRLPTTIHNQYLYIDSDCGNNGLLEHRIETTSEVVSILIG
jgi:hypothetical protein